MKHSYKIFLIAGLFVILTMIIAFHLSNEANAQNQSKSISNLLKSYVGQSFEVDFGDRNTQYGFTLKEVNLDYLVLEAIQDQSKVRVIFPINAIASLVFSQKSPAEKEVLFRLKLFNNEGINHEH